MPENKKAELDKTPTQAFTDTVGGILEGFGQGFREVLMGRNIGELVGLWIMSLISVKLVISEIRAFLHSDESLIRLQHEQRLKLLGLLTEHSEVFLLACKETLQEGYEEILDKGTEVYVYLARIDQEIATSIKLNTAEINAETVLLIRRRQAMSLFSPLGWFGKQFKLFPRWYKPIAIEEVS